VRVEAQYRFRLPVAPAENRRAQWRSRAQPTAAAEPAGTADKRALPRPERADTAMPEAQHRDTVAAHRIAALGPGQHLAPRGTAAAVLRDRRPQAVDRPLQAVDKLPRAVDKRRADSRAQALLRAGTAAGQPAGSMPGALNG